MQRDFYDVLTKWKNENILTPLLVVGARQVGKTYIIDKFCRENFSDYVYVNLQENTRVINIFESDMNMDEKASAFFLEIRCTLNEETVIFIDEAQEFEDVIASMKYFNENKYPYKFILAGSLLGVKLSRFHKSFPVGKVEFAYMYPMSFKEFLVAIGKEKFVSIIRECFNNNKPMNDNFHEELLMDYRNFLCTGGYPKFVQAFLNNKNILQKNGSNDLRNIIDSYLFDMNKFTNNMSETAKIEKIYRNVPSQLTKENKKYQISKISANARYRDYESAVDWLLAILLITLKHLLKHLWMKQLLRFI